jgi:hypothetical protein
MGVALAAEAVYGVRPGGGQVLGAEDFDHGSTLAWFAALDTALQRDGSDIAEVQDFHERYRLTRRSMTNTAAGP